MNTTVLHELIEALTALGLYLERSEREFQDQSQLMPEGFDQIIEKSLGQYERCLAAIRRLQDLLRREAVCATHREPHEEVGS
jgi:signal transduction histidine kinase